jgi:hypothetical protein
VMRSVAIVEPGARTNHLFNLPVYQDADGRFKETYGSRPFALLVRPDCHLCWHGESWRDLALRHQLDRAFVPKDGVSVRGRRRNTRSSARIN